MRSFKTEEEALNFLQTLHWGNAAGTCKDKDFAIKCASAGMPAVMFGSITKEQRNGNSGGDFYYDSKTGNSINALGLPNAGFDNYIKILPDLKKEVNRQNSKLWVSISAGDYFMPNDFFQMSEGIASADAADIIEADLSCPNVGRGIQQLMCFDPLQFMTGVGVLREGAPKIPIAIKLAPITEKALLNELVDICLGHGIDYIVCSNTIGNCYLGTDDGKPALPGTILGGMAGKALRPIVSGMIKMIVPKIKRTKTRIIAVGGIENGTDAYEYLCLGEGMVVGFQFNTALSRRGEDLKFVVEMVFGKDNEPGLLELLVKHGLPWE